MKTDELVYREHIVPYSREKLVNKLKEALDESRFQHVLRVEQTAVNLAVENGEDVERASIAGMVHDYAKQRPDQDFVRAIKEYQLPKSLLDYGNAIWHGVVGWIFVMNELEINDTDVLHAVEYHTVGHEYMSQLAQIVYMADYIEPQRSFNGVQKAREITHKNLALGVAYQTKQTLEYLVANNKPIYPQTIITYNSWVPNSDLY